MILKLKWCTSFSLLPFCFLAKTQNTDAVLPNVTLTVRNSKKGLKYLWNGGRTIEFSGSEPVLFNHL